MESYRLIQRIVRDCYQELKDVDYEFIRLGIIQEDILNEHQLSNLKVKTQRQQNEILFQEYAPVLGMARFKKLINVIRVDYQHVAQALIQKLNSLNSNQSSNESSPNVSSVSSVGGFHSDVRGAEISTLIGAEGGAGIDSQSVSIKSGVMPQSVLTEHSNNSGRMGLPDLPLPVPGQLRLTGTECTEDVYNALRKEPGLSIQLGLNFIPENESSHNYSSTTFVKQVAGSQSTLGTCENTHVKQLAAFQGDGQSIDQAQREEAYKMDSQPRGIAFIVSNEDFDQFSQRKGTEHDRKNLMLMFKDLGWDVTSKSNLTAKEMDKYLRKLANSRRLDSTSALAVAILTHGLNNDTLFGTDGRLINKNEPAQGTYINRFQLMKIFSRSCCPQMKKKPKWFILQACRGNEEDKLPGLVTKTVQRVPTSHGMKSDGPVPDSLPPGPSGDEQETPELSDMCCLFASSPGHKAYRMMNSGSPFIQELIKCVRSHAHDTELSKIVRKVRSEMAKKPLPDNKLTLPEFSSLLLKDWFLNPPVFYTGELTQSV